jgi:hypothetical protein
MKLRFLVLCLAIVLIPVAGRAQVGIYVNPIGINVHNSLPDTGIFAFLGPNATSRTFWGVNIGGYYDFFQTKKAIIGIDLRDSIVKGNSASLNNFLIGVRVSAKPIANSFKPYAQLSGGVGTSKPPHNPASKSKAEYNVSAGLDYTLNRHVDFRVVELGYGGVTTVNSGDFQGPVQFPSSRLFSVSTGLVFRFH